jgi:ATP-dependent helicase/nuclease subunit B
MADVKLIREMDHTIDGASLIIPARMNKGDTLGRSLRFLENIQILRNYVGNF